MKPFEVANLFKHRSLKSLDGRASAHLCVFVVSRALEKEDRYESVAWRFDAETGPRAMTSPLFDVKSAQLDPKGARLAFLSKRDGNSEQIHILPLDGGEAAQLGHSDAQLKSIEMWSPGGDRLLLLASVPWAEDDRDDPEAKARPQVVDHLPYKQDGKGAIVGVRTRIYQIETGTGKLTPLVEGDFDVEQAQWSPDGRYLAYVRGRGGSQRHRSDLWLADADGGNARRISGQLATLSGLRWSPDGSLLAFGGCENEGDSLSHLWFYRPQDDALYRPGDNKLHLEGSQILWHADGRRLATIEAHRGLHRVAVVDADSGRIEHLDVGLRHVSGLCAFGDRIAVVAASMRNAEEIHSLSWEGGDPQCHTDFNRRWLKRETRPRVIKRRFEVPDGKSGRERIEAWLLRPPGPGPFPTLIDFHGGPQSVALIDFASHVYWHALVAKGWMVVAPNAIGSGSYGEDFAERLRGRWGEIDFPQHLAILDTLQREGIADERLACTGKSYGGFLTAWALGHSRRFKAAVVSAPVVDIESHAGTSDTGYYVTPYAMAGEMSEARERWHALSPIQYCQVANAAALLLQGEKDERCPLGQSEELFAGLVRCAKAPAKMVVYPGGSHSLASSGKPSHRLDYHARIVDWLEHWTNGTSGS